MVLPLPEYTAASARDAGTPPAWSLRFDAEPALCERARQGDDVVVCLHGLVANVALLKPLRSRLERHEGIHAATMSYRIGPGLRCLARHLRELLSELPGGVRIHLLGHSVGGVVVRYFAQEIGDARVMQTISLAAPFGGVAPGDWLHADIAEDLDPRSQLLRMLRLSSRRRLALPHLSLVAERDCVLASPRRQALPQGDIALIRRCGHSGLLFHRDAAAIIENRVLSLTHLRLRAG